MTTLHQHIAEGFFAKLAEAKHVDAVKIGQFRVLLADGKRVRGDDFVKIFSQPDGGDIK